MSENQAEEAPVPVFEEKSFPEQDEHIDPPGHKLATSIDNSTPCSARSEEDKVLNERKASIEQNSASQNNSLHDSPVSMSKNEAEVNSIDSQATDNTHDGSIPSSHSIMSGKSDQPSMSPSSEVATQERNLEPIESNKSQGTSLPDKKIMGSKDADGAHLTRNDAESGNSCRNSSHALSDVTADSLSVCGGNEEDIGSMSSSITRSSSQSVQPPPPPNATPFLNARSQVMRESLPSLRGSAGSASRSLGSSMDVLTLPADIRTPSPDPNSGRSARRPSAAETTTDVASGLSTGSKAFASSNNLPKETEMRVQQLIRACMRQDLNTIDTLLAKGVPVIKIQPEVGVRGSSSMMQKVPRVPEHPFLAAAVSGNVGVLHKLFPYSSPNDINVCNFAGRCPLHIASKLDHADTVSWLLEQGADEGKRDRSNATAMHHAAFGGATRALRVLLSKSSIGVNSRDSDGNTPLHQAAAKGHIETAKLLLLSGADIQAKNDHGRTALMYSHRFGHVAMGKMLADRLSKLQTLSRHTQAPPGTQSISHNQAVITRQEAASTSHVLARSMDQDHVIGLRTPPTERGHANKDGTNDHEDQASFPKQRITSAPSSGASGRESNSHYTTGQSASTELHHSSLPGSNNLTPTLTYLQDGMVLSPTQSAELKSSHGGASIDIASPALSAQEGQQSFSRHTLSSSSLQPVGSRSGFQPSTSAPTSFEAYKRPSTLRGDSSSIFSRGDEWYAAARTKQHLAQSMSHAKGAAGVQESWNVPTGGSDSKQNIGSNTLTSHGSQASSQNQSSIAASIPSPVEAGDLNGQHSERSRRPKWITGSGNVSGLQEHVQMSEAKPIQAAASNLPYSQHHQSGLDSKQLRSQMPTMTRTSAQHQAAAVVRPLQPNHVTSVQQAGSLAAIKHAQHAADQSKKSRHVQLQDNLSQSADASQIGIPSDPADEIDGVPSSWLESAAQSSDLTSDVNLASSISVSDSGMHDLSWAHARVAYLKQQMIGGEDPSSGTYSRNISMDKSGHSIAEKHPPQRDENGSIQSLDNTTLSTNNVVAVGSSSLYELQNLWGLAASINVTPPKEEILQGLLNEYMDSTPAALMQKGVVEVLKNVHSRTSNSSAPLWQQDQWANAVKDTLLKDSE